MRPRIAFTRPDERAYASHVAHGIPRAASFAAPVGGAMGRSFAPGFRDQPATARPRAASDAGPSGVGHHTANMSALLGRITAVAEQGGLERLGKQRSASLSARIAPGAAMPRREPATHAGEVGHLGARGDESLTEGAAASGSSPTSSTFYHGDPKVLACSRLLLSCDGADSPRITIVHADRLTGSTFGYPEGELVGSEFFSLFEKVNREHTLSSARKEIVKAVKKREKIKKYLNVTHGKLNTDQLPATSCSIELRPMVGPVATLPAASQWPVHYLAIVRNAASIQYMSDIGQFLNAELDKQFAELARRRNGEAHGGAEARASASEEQDAATPGLSARLLQVGLDAVASPVPEARGPLAALAAGEEPLAV